MTKPVVLPTKERVEVVVTLKGEEYRFIGDWAGAKRFVEALRTFHVPKGVA